MKLSRRNFIKASAALAAAVAGLAGGLKNRIPVLQAFTEKKTISPDYSERWIATTCQGCTTWCPVQVKVVNGRAIKVMGNPNSKSTDGQVCPRSSLSLQQVYDPDRVKVPMKRTNLRKGKDEDPEFVPITWDEAIDEITTRMMELRKNNEAHKYVLLRGRYTNLSEVLYDKFTKLFGSPNNISHSAICAEAEKFGSYYTEGFWDYRDYDLLKTRYVLLWGGDPIASNRQVTHSLFSWGEVMDRAKIAVVDPRLSITASKADEWLPVIPGEDGALALAIAHVILVEGKWYREFVGDFKDGINRFREGEYVAQGTFLEKHTYGLIRWWNLELRNRTPEWAEKITGIPASQIIRVAREFADAAPRAISWMTPGPSMQVRGAYSAMATHALNGLVGSVDNEGGTLRGSKVPTEHGLQGFENYIDEIAERGIEQPKIDHRGYLEFPALKDGKSGGGVVTNRVADAIIDEDPYDVKIVVGYWNNFVFSCGGTSRWDKALSKLPFFVHITTHPAEMTKYADIVLPTTHHEFEKWSYVKSKANRYAYCTLNQRVIEPVWDVKIDETEIPWLIAEKLAEKGFDNIIRCFKEQVRDPETGKAPANGLDFTIFMLKTETKPLWDPTMEAEGDRLKGWEDFKEKGVWNSVPYPYRKKWDNFGTVTGKFELYSETLKQALEKHAERHNTSVDNVMRACKLQAIGEIAFIPHHEEAYRLGDPQEYPLIFVDHKSRLNREGRSANCSWYQEIKDVDPGDEKWDDVAKINPQDGVELGIKNGDNIKIVSPTGELMCTAKLWEGVRPGTVVKCYGQGHWAYGRIAALDFYKRLPRGGNNNDILPAEYERLSGSTARHGGVTRVRIEKV